MTPDLRWYRMTCVCYRPGCMVGYVPDMSGYCRVPGEVERKEAT